MSEPIKLTQYAHGAGCGCKIAPLVLQEILREKLTIPSDRLLVGNDTGDDAAVYDLGNGDALIITTDFFTPIVDDPFTFGQVAAANALSDVYAMGGKPITAISILGWPVEKIPPSVAGEVLKGAREICAKAGILISGGHSIDSPEPFFGLSVNGLVAINHIKKNNSAKAGDLLLMTKRLGSGILSTTQKRKGLESGYQKEWIEQLITLNQFGAIAGKETGVNAMTDITGFGLLGHLVEMTEGSGLHAVINYKEIPVLEGVRDAVKNGMIPDATYRNWNAYGDKVSIAPGIDPMEAFAILPDPQTNGGLLIAIDPGEASKLKMLAAANQVVLFELGFFENKKELTASFM